MFVSTFSFIFSILRTVCLSSVAVAERSSVTRAGAGRVIVLGVRPLFVVDFAANASGAEAKVTVAINASVACVNLTFMTMIP